MPTGERARLRPFDLASRRVARARAATLIEGRDEVLRHARDELAARRALMKGCPEGRTLVIGMLAGAGMGDLLADCAAWARPTREPRLVAEEGRLPIRDGSLACLMSIMTLHGVNDLPGALVLARRALMPGGAYLAVFPAGNSGIEVRRAFLAADAASGRGVSARVGPTVDCAQAAGLLQRAGFADPVAEVETLRLAYGSLAEVARDVRAHGDSGWLTARPRGLTGPRRWAAAEAAFAQGRRADGRVEVTVELLYLAGRVR